MNRAQCSQFVKINRGITGMDEISLPFPGRFHVDEVLSAVLAKIINPECNIILITPEGVDKVITKTYREAYKGDLMETEWWGTKEISATYSILFNKKDDLIKAGCIDKNIDHLVERFASIEAALNHRCDSNIMNYVDAMLPRWNDDRSAEKLFMEAVDMIKDHVVEPYLKGETLDHHSLVFNDAVRDAIAEKEKAMKEAQAIVNEEMVRLKNVTGFEPEKYVAIFDKPLPVMDLELDPEVVYAICPAKSGYMLQVIPNEIGVVKMPLQHTICNKRFVQSYGQASTVFDTLDDAKHAAYEHISLEMDKFCKTVADNRTEPMSYWTIQERAQKMFEAFITDDIDKAQEAMDIGEDADDIEEDADDIEV